MLFDFSDACNFVLVIFGLASIQLSGFPPQLNKPLALFAIGIDCCVVYSIPDVCCVTNRLIFPGPHNE